jgi:hypothetical protein
MNVTLCLGLYILLRRDDVHHNRALDDTQTFDPVNVARNVRHGLNVDCQIQVIGDRPLRGRRNRARQRFIRPRADGYQGGVLGCTSILQRSRCA